MHLFTFGFPLGIHYGRDPKELPWSSRLQWQLRGVVRVWLGGHMLVAQIDRNEGFGEFDAALVGQQRAHTYR